MRERESRPTRAASEPGEVDPILQDSPDIRPANPRYEMYLAGWARGFEARQAEIDRLQFECDRLWMWAFNPPAKINPNAKSYSDLERIRGNGANADRIDADNARRFAEVSA